MLATDPTCSVVFVQEPVAFDAATGADRAPIVSSRTSPSASPGVEPFGARLAVVPGHADHSDLALYVVDLADPAALGVRLDGSGVGSTQPIALDEREGRVYVAGAEVLTAWPTSCPGNNCAPLWTFGGTGTLAGPVVDATGVYTVDPQEQSLLALDLATGLPMWSASVTPQEPPVRPAVRNGTVYAVGGNAALAVFEDCGEATCLPVWQGTTGLSAGQSLTPVVARDAVYVARGAGLLHETRVDVFAADGCGAEQCPSLATLAVTGDPLEVMVADGHVVVRTTSGIHVFGLPA